MITHSTFNQQSILDAWAPPPYAPGHEWAVYAVSKAGTEKALWAFKEEFRPGWGICSVIPDTNFGLMLDPASQWNSTAGFVRKLYNGEIEKLKGVAPRKSPSL